MRLRDDIDPANTWVVSDTHFGHDNIVGFSHRPIDHEQVMVAEWRKEVPPHATILHLGDVSFRNNAFFKHVIAKDLTGERKLLIKGNHDKSGNALYRDAGFQVVKPFGIRYRDHVVSFSHYPWGDPTNKQSDDVGTMPSNYVRVHGHIHNNGYTRDAFVPFRKNHINLSVEQTKYKPVNLKLLLDAYLFDKYPRTTEEQLAEAAARKAAHMARKER
jgi:calcineurin-like phosphoesterase family protein